jgi:hypothetical protein
MFPKKKLEGEVMVSIVRTSFKPEHESAKERRGENVLWSF